MEPIRVLHVVGNMDAGGMETLIMNWYRIIDREKVQFDFLVHSKKTGFYEQEISQLGGKVYHLSFLDDKNFVSYVSSLKNFFCEHKEYKVLHGHHSSLGPIYLRVAKLYSIPCRISHSHIASYSKSLRGVVKYFITRYYGKFANTHLACSNAAGKYMYNDKTDYKVVNNGIDVGKFAYSEAVRSRKRMELEIADEKVIIHVGRFFDQKNHGFLINIFSDLHKKAPETKLLLVGVGPLKCSIEEKVSKLGLNDAVRFLNNRDDVNELLCAADMFLFPSLYEGLPLTLVEAQASGLPVVCSNTITEETRLTDFYRIVDLAAPISVWTENVLEALRSEVDREKAYMLVKNQGYDSRDVVLDMQDFYLRKYDENFIIG